jgi:hypothetical protein
MPATSADNSILATGRPVRIPTPDGKSGSPKLLREFTAQDTSGSNPPPVPLVLPIDKTGAFHPLARARSGRCYSNFS